MYLGQGRALVLPAWGDAFFETLFGATVQKVVWPDLLTLCVYSRHARADNVGFVKLLSEWLLWQQVFFCVYTFHLKSPKASITQRLICICKHSM